ncbi:hypothetical protein HW132_15385 [Brasilonema sp. CT11]|nr:hypothetical protein [Brasilonema sp. CT11]
MTISLSSLNNEYLTLADQRFSLEELWQLNLNTLKATFLGEAEKMSTALSGKRFDRIFEVWAKV